MPRRRPWISYAGDILLTVAFLFRNSFETVLFQFCFRLISIVRTRSFSLYPFGERNSLQPPGVVRPCVQHPSRCSTAWCSTPGADRVSAGISWSQFIDNSTHESRIVAHRRTDGQMDVGVPIAAKNPRPPPARLSSPYLDALALAESARLRPGQLFSVPTETATGVRACWRFGTLRRLGATQRVDDRGHRRPNSRRATRTWQMRNYATEKNTAKKNIAGGY